MTIHTIAPGPPVVIARAVPAIVPVPKFPPMIAATAAKLLIFFSACCGRNINRTPSIKCRNCGHFILIDRKMDVDSSNGMMTTKTKYSNASNCSKATSKYDIKYRLQYDIRRCFQSIVKRSRKFSYFHTDIFYKSHKPTCCFYCERIS